MVIPVSMELISEMNLLKVFEIVIIGIADVYMLGVQIRYPIL